MPPDELAVFGFHLPSGLRATCAAYHVPTKIIIIIVIIVVVVVICIHHFKPFLFCCSFFQHSASSLLLLLGLSFLHSQDAQQHTKKINYGMLWKNSSFQHITFIVHLHVDTTHSAVTRASHFQRRFLLCPLFSSLFVALSLSAAAPFIPFAAPHKSSPSRTRTIICVIIFIYARNDKQ